MSPEQLGGQSHTIDERSDIYSLAKVLQQMLTVPGDLLAICERATAHDPDQRYQSAGEFARALRDFIDCQTPMLKRYWRPILTMAIASAACLVFSLLSWLSQSRAMERKSAEQAVEAFLQSAPNVLTLKAESSVLGSTMALRTCNSPPRPATKNKRLRA